jgi:hypothetical protein
VAEITHWDAGDRCLAVEYDDADGQPKRGGQVLPATVEYTDRHGFVFADIPSLSRSIAFMAGTGRAFGSNSGWRLIKACQCGIGGGPATVIPPACPVHGIPCEHCGGIENCTDDCGEGCEATGTPSGTVCGVTPAALYAGACEHGHPREGRLCAKHASPPAALWCRECFELEGEASHVCDVTPVLVAEAAQAAGTEASRG